MKVQFAEKFALFSDLLLDYNKKYNLTSITEQKDVVYKHFIDSLAGEFLFSQGDNVLEVGSGAGFPSLPLKIVREDLHFTLVESTGKKCEFLKTAVKELGLSHVEVINARAEELAKDETYREKFDTCCARAVARLNTLSEYCIPFIKVGGKMIAYKGEAQDEVTEAKKAVSLLGGGKAQEFSYSLPEGYGKRTLVCIPKQSSTPSKYPRGNGKERKVPLS
ncbi:MAG: 16S rRNA (guanine(527)-N(7))-methyltransferase RsmG [Clostridiales bacterium]|nr:16S rRNA (guanine(527)-N(7))-methyltransferase RsmG [Clostridiales bacterium]